MGYRVPMRVGDRVALAPHLDLWMEGVRYGTVIERKTSEDGGPAMLLVAYGLAGQTVWLSTDDLLGAVR